MEHLIRELIAQDHSLLDNGRGVPDWCLADNAVSQDLHYAGFTSNDLHSLLPCDM